MGSLVGTLGQVRSGLELRRQKDAALEAIKIDHRFNDGSHMFEYGSPSDQNPRIEALQRWAKCLTARTDTQARFDDERLDEQFAQVDLARRILHISPTVIYRYAMESLAGTGFPRHKQFVKVARRYRGQFVDFIIEADRADPDSLHVYYVKEGLSKKPVSFDAVPRFVEPSGVGVAMEAALMDFSLLILIALLCFMVSYVAFLKSSVR